MKRSPLRRLRAVLLLAALTALAGSVRSGASPRPLVPRAAAPSAVTATVLYGFNSTVEGYPNHGLTQGPDGSLYGVTNGKADTVFQIAPDGTFHSLHRFSSSDDQDGFLLGAKLLLVGNQLFGTSLVGGLGNGLVFVIDLSKVRPADNAAGFGVIHYFKYSSDGVEPGGDLFLASDGNLYGTTAYSTALSSAGTIFQIKPDSSGHFSITPRTTPAGMDAFNGGFMVIYDFGADTGLHPFAGVVQGPDGFLYGTTTRGGGPFDVGGVYKVGTDGRGFTLLHASSVRDGSYLQSVPLFASDGSLCGTAPYGGPAQAGTVFQIQPGADGVFSANAPFQVFHGLTDYLAGYQPIGGLIQASDGSLYGATNGGGAFDGADGTVFRIAASGGQFSAASPFSSIYSFGASADNNTGAYSVSGPLIQGRDGRLYGETVAGGPGGGGAVFALDAGLPAPPAVSGIAGSIAPPDATTADTTLVVHGGSFIGGDRVAIDGLNVPVASRDYSKAADEQITVTLSAPLRAGAHTVVIADTAPGIRVSSPVAFLVTLLRPTIVQITRGGGGSVTTADTTLVIHGDSFTPTDVIGGLSGATITQKSLDNSGSQFTLTLSKPLAAGHYAVTVTHLAPNGLVSNTYDMEVLTDSPVISAVSGSSNPPAVTPNDTTLIVHGTGFAGADAVVLTGTTASASVAGRDLTTNPADEQITVTLSQPLAAGSYTAAVVHAAPDNRKSAAFAFTVVRSAAPTITSTAYSAKTGQGVLNISGTGFVRTGTTRLTPNDPNVKPGGTPTVTFISSTRLTATFSQPLPVGVYTLTETNPDGQAAQASVSVLGPPVITSLVYHATSSDSTLTINGSGFIETPNVGLASAPLGTVLKLKLPISPTQLIVTLDHLLPAGSQQVTVTNPDNQKATGTLTVGGAPSITAGGLTAVTGPSGNTVLVVTGRNLAGVTVDGVALTPDSAATVANSIGALITQLLFRLPSRFGDGSHAVVARNADGLGTNGTVVPPPGGRAAGPASSPASSTVSVFTSDRTSYQVASDSDGGLWGWFIGLFGFHLHSNGGTPTQVIASNSSALLKLPIIPVTAVGGGALTALISQEGAGLISQDGGGVISNDGGSIVSRLISQDGGGVISNDGGSLISQDGGGVISNDGGSLLAKAQMVTVDDAKAANNSVDFLKPTASAAFRAPLASSGGGPTLDISKSGQAGTGSSDMTLTSQDISGNSVDVLRMRFTAGERDLVLYEAPGFHLTPTNGTPPPVAAVTANVTVTRGPVTRDSHTHQPFQVLTLTNTGTAPLAGPFLIGLTGLPAGVSVAGPSSVLAGSPAVPVPGGTATGSALAPGASVRVRVDFADPTNVRFSYGTAVYAGL